MVCKISPLAACALLVWVLATGCAAASTPSPAPTPESVFAAMKAATGGARWDAVGELEEHSDTEQGGQQGHCTQYQDLRTGRSATYCTLGGLPSAQGFDGRRSWFMDGKSMVSLRASIQAQRQTATDAYLTRNGWFRSPSTDPAEMRYVGERQDATGSFDVVHVVPEGGMAFDAWIERSTHRLGRVVEETDDGGRQITRYADYRPVDGLLIPYLQRVGNGDTQYDMTLHLQRIAVQPAPNDAHFAMPSSTVHDAYITGNEPSASVPFASYAGLIMVNVSIGGAKPLPFILDTGGLNLLTPDAARKLGIAGSGNLPVEGVGAATQSMQTAKVAQYRVGNVVMEDQDFLIVDLPRLLTDRGAREPVAGIIGYELLRRFVTRIDYDRHMLTFTPIALFHGLPGAASIPIVFDGRTPQVGARADGAMGTFNLDTGDSGELTLFAPFAKAHGIVALGRKIASAGRGAGGKVGMVYAHIRELDIGPFAIEHPAASFTAAAKGVFASQLLAGNIGYGTLSRFVLTFDYERDRLYLEKSERFAHVSPPNRTGVGLDRVEHDAFVAATIEPGSPAEQAGLRVGDRVVAIDDVPAAQLGLDDIQRILRQPAGTRLTLSIARQGAIRPHTLILRDLSQ